MALLDDPQTLDLVRKARDGNEDAWRTLVDGLAKSLHRLAKLKLDPRLAARFAPEDLVQEALLDAFRSLEKFFRQACPLSFSFWLRQRLVDQIDRVHRDHCVTQKHSVRREVATRQDSSESRPDLLSVLLDPGTSPSHDLTRDEARRLVAEEISRLPDVDREILVLFSFEGYSHAEIGRILDLSPVAVTARQHRAVKHLASLLRRNHSDWCHDAFPTAHRTA